MSNAFQSKSRAQAIVMLIIGTALVAVGIAGWLTAEMRPLAGTGYALIGLGFAWSGVRWFRRAEPRA